MEQIETQASDLRYLVAQAPVALSDTASVSYDTPQQASPPPSGSGAVGENSAANANKRRSVDDGPGSGQKQTRSKRNRYISIACNECKRRKIKCNGETPCQRCGNLNLACLYAPNCCTSSFKDSDDFKNVVAQVSRLQDEVSRLNQTVKVLQADSSSRLAPAAAPKYRLARPGVSARAPASPPGVLPWPSCLLP
ncbi:hypothetical protein CDD83_1050 [Cordyceps sp. RAO-2017]|nr:hypothetical protein CDD83_1050 [Cordyceps sp. RAO-2017]